MSAAFGGPRSATRPGPGPTPEALLRALDVTVGRRIRGLVPGVYRAHDLGGGTELAQVRPYEPGDDVRRMDWNVTARTSVPHVRIHVPERALTTWLLLDVSPSMTFGTADRRKADVAEGVGLAIGHIATQRGNRLGLITFGGPNDRRVPAAGGRRGLLALLLAARNDGDASGAGDAAPAPRGMLGATSADGAKSVGATSPAAVPSIGATSPDGANSVGATSPAAALRLVAAAAPRGGLVAIVSDFRGTRSWVPSLAAVTARHQVLAVEIRDPREDALPDVGDLTLIDAETGREVRVDTSSRTLRERFAAAAADERRSLSAELRRLGVDHVVLYTSGSWLRSLAGQLRTIGIAS